ncbi:MAG: Asp-tRNA(Asn)/Glu-tRNA(Gln) amidotransferase subunit GatA, partial [Candidatus Hydrogenedentota bacterium]
MSVATRRRSARDIRDHIASGEISCEEVTSEYLARIRTLDDPLHAFLDVWTDDAVERARALDARRQAGENLGPLGGVPIALKDVICTRRGTTTCGSRILEGYRSPYDATVVQKLEAAGAVILGKLNMDEFAMGSSTENSAFGPSRNPWDLSRVPGGSSGGSAAAVSADMTPLALGSDTGGSVRQPAAFCGCVGLKPTYGRVSRYGLVAYASSLDQIGPLTQTVYDAALVLSVIAGKDPLDSTSADVPVPNYVDQLERSVEGLTLGVPKEYFAGALNREIGAAIEGAIAAFERNGAKIIEVSLPHTEYTIAAYYIIATAEASANLARFDGVRYGPRETGAREVDDLYRRTKSARFGKEVQRRIMLGTYVLSSGYYDAYYLKAQKVRRLIRQDFDAAFERCDLLITPTAPTVAYKLGEKTGDPLEMYLGDIYTTSINLAGVPAISLPCGLNSERLPIGMQLIGTPFGEPALLRAAHAYEQF